jgi:hypothetical protein
MADSNLKKKTAPKPLKNFEFDSVNLDLKPQFFFTKNSKKKNSNLAFKTEKSNEPGSS